MEALVRERRTYQNANRNTDHVPVRLLPDWQRNALLQRLARALRSQQQVALHLDRAIILGGFVHRMLELLSSSLSRAIA